MQEQIQRNLYVLRDLSRCRSVQEFVSIQSELLRDNVQHTFEDTRRLAGVSARIAEEATRTVAQQSSGNLQSSSCLEGLSETGLKSSAPALSSSAGAVG